MSDDAPTPDLPDPDLPDPDLPNPDLPNPDLPEIDVRNNPESRAGAERGAAPVARAGGGEGGAPTRDAPPAGEDPEPVEGGTAAGNPVAGVQLSAEDVEEAVEPDQNAMEIDGPQAGHA